MEILIKNNLGDGKGNGLEPVGAYYTGKRLSHGNGSGAGTGSNLIKRKGTGDGKGSGDGEGVNIKNFKEALCYGTGHGVGNYDYLKETNPAFFSSPNL